MSDHGDAASRPGLSSLRDGAAGASPPKASIPTAVGSRWRARDGRIMRVTALFITPGGHTKVCCEVENAKGRMVVVTALDSAKFGPGRFLKPLIAEIFLPHDTPSGSRSP